MDEEDCQLAMKSQGWVVKCSKTWQIYNWFYAFMMDFLDGSTVWKGLSSVVKETGSSSILASVDSLKCLPLFPFEDGYYGKGNIIVNN